MLQYTKPVEGDVELSPKKQVFKFAKFKYNNIH